MKKVTLSVDLVFSVPDDTPTERLYVQFPGGNPVLQGSYSPVENSTFVSHETREIDTFEE